MTRMQIVAGTGFQGWHALNDTVMGGRSSGGCDITDSGLAFRGEVVEAGGGFISCRSPLFSPPLDLSRHGGLELELSADGRRFKLAVACGDGLAGLTELIPGGLRWVHDFDTTNASHQRLTIRFDALQPSIRARPLEGLPLGLPLRFDPSKITRLQLLHSRFGDDGLPNMGFRAGPLELVLHRIDAVP